MKRIIAFLFAVFLVVGSVIPAYATEISDVTEPVETEPSEVPTDPTEPSEPAIVWTDVYESVYSTSNVNVRSGPGTDFDVIGSLPVNTMVQRVAVADNGWSKVVYQEVVVYVSSKYLTTVQPVDYVPPSEDPLKVDLTENSIQAIADAVMSASAVEYQYQYQYEASFEYNGKNVVIVFDTNVEDFFNSYTVAIGGLYTDPSAVFLNPRLYVGSDGIALASSPRLVDINLSDISDGFHVISFESFVLDDLNKTTLRAFNTFWTSKHIYNYQTGELLVKSTYAPPIIYTVDFVTNIDGYTLPSQPSNKFELPSPEYPNKLFLGFYTDPELTQPYGGGEITESFTLYLKWSDLPPMTFFSSSLFDGLSALFECEPILYILSIMGLAIVVYIIKMIISART